MDDLARAVRTASDYVAGFRADEAERPVGAAHGIARMRAAFARPLPSAGANPDEVIAELIATADPGIVASAGPRYFGFVVGGALAAATAADILTTGWDQNAFTDVMSPAAIAAEECAGGWVKDVLGIPAHASVGFVTGAQQANTVCLAAARHHMYAVADWDIERDGFAGAPRVRVLANEERHATIDRSLRLLGFGTAALEPVRADANGAIDTGDLARVLAAGPSGPVIVCLQAGNVNTGAFDGLREACRIIHAHGGWAHVDGAFGLWAAANPPTRFLVDGIELADSWGCDAHKWLNVPYDSAFAIVAQPGVHAAAVSYTAPYLVTSSGARGGGDFTLESSRRARGFAVWAAMRELGRDGIADLVERCCVLARRFAAGLDRGGVTIGNDVVLNQVLASFGTDEETDRVIAAVQAGGECWAGGTTWHGRRYMRISVSNYRTTEADVDRSVEAMLRARG